MGEASQENQRTYIYRASTGEDKYSGDSIATKEKVTSSGNGQGGAASDGTVYDVPSFEHDAPKSGDGGAFPVVETQERSFAHPLEGYTGTLAVRSHFTGVMQENDLAKLEKDCDFRMLGDTAVDVVATLGNDEVPASTGSAHATSTPSTLLASISKSPTLSDMDTPIADNRCCQTDNVDEGMLARGGDRESTIGRTPSTSTLNLWPELQRASGPSDGLGDDLSTISTVTTAIDSIGREAVDFDLNAFFNGMNDKEQATGDDKKYICSGCRRKLMICSAVMTIKH